MTTICHLSLGLQKSSSMHLFSSCKASQFCSFDPARVKKVQSNPTATSSASWKKTWAINHDSTSTNTISTSRTRSFALKREIISSFSRETKSIETLQCSFKRLDNTQEALGQKFHLTWALPFFGLGRSKLVFVKKLEHELIVLFSYRKKQTSFKTD